MNWLKAALLVAGIGAIVTGVALLSVSASFIAGGSMLLGVLYLISVGEVRK